MGRVRIACRKRGDQEPDRSSRVDQRQYPGIPASFAAVRFYIRLGARNFHVRAGILPLESVAVPADAGERNRISQEEPGELVSGLRDGSGKRAGDRRILLASRDDARGTEGTRSVVFE